MSDVRIGLVAEGKTVVSVLHEISFALQADELDAAWLGENAREEHLR